MLNYPANNVNLTDSDVKGIKGIELFSLTSPKVTALQEAYVRKVIDTVNDLDNVFYEIANESDFATTEWQYHMIRFIKSYESAKPRQHPVGMTSIGYGVDDLVYQPKPGESFSVELKAGTYRYEWFNPAKSACTDTGRLEATDGRQQFKAPFEPDAVLYLKAQ